VGFGAKGRGSGRSRREACRRDLVGRQAAGQIGEESERSPVGHAGVILDEHRESSYIALCQYYNSILLGFRLCERPCLCPRAPDTPGPMTSTASSTGRSFRTWASPEWCSTSSST